MVKIFLNSKKNNNICLKKRKILLQYYPHSTKCGEKKEDQIFKKKTIDTNLKNDFLGNTNNDEPSEMLYVF